MKAVVLAAGRGSRLAPITDDRPKPLVLVGGRPLLLRTIQRITAAGIADKDIVIVTGYREAMVAALMRAEGLRCRLVYNPRWSEWNSFYSMVVAREALWGSSFLLAEGDVVFDERVLPRLLAAPGPAALAVDRAHLPRPGEMKAVIDVEGRVTALSKRAAPAGGWWPGLARLDDAVGREVLTDVERFPDEGLVHEHYDHSIHRLAARGVGPFWAVDVAECGVVEINDPRDLARAEAALASR